MIEGLNEPAVREMVLQELLTITEGDGRMAHSDERSFLQNPHQSPILRTAWSVGWLRARDMASGMVQG